MFRLMVMGTDEESDLAYESKSDMSNVSYNMSVSMGECVIYSVASSSSRCLKCW